jgi:hypothetical protein
VRHAEPTARLGSAQTRQGPGGPWIPDEKLAPVHTDWLRNRLTVSGPAGEVPAATPVYRPALGELFRIPEALIRMRARVAAMREPRPLEAFLPEVPAEKRGEPVIIRSAVASTFVAALELCRGAVVGLDQGDDFGMITVSPRVDDAERAAAIAIWVA